METASGVATKVSGRVLQEIDGEPAAEVHARWARSADIAAAVTPEVRPESILGESTLHPLAKAIRQEAPSKADDAASGGGGASSGGEEGRPTFTTLTPGGAAGLEEARNVDFHSLIHPKAIVDGNGLEMFATVNEGEKICCLEATVDELDRCTEEVLRPSVGVISKDCGRCLFIAEVARWR